MLGHKVIYVRCTKRSYNNVAKDIRHLDKKAIFVHTASKGFWKIYPHNTLLLCLAKEPTEPKLDSSRRLNFNWAIWKLMLV